MLTVTIVSYMYIINGDHTFNLKAKKGLRQWDTLPLALCYCDRVPLHDPPKDEEEPEIQFSF